MTKVIVLDANGQQLSPTTIEKARKLVARGKAALVNEEPFTIQLPYAVDLPPEPKPVKERPIGEGRRILLHICCGPCSTYTIERLQEEGFAVTGFWYNPNIHPWQEHQQRRESLVRYTEAVSLPMIWHERYEMHLFLRAVVGHERFRQRCAICYRMRLEKTAQVAAEQGFDAFTTTLLISPHQDQELIRQVGEEMAAQHGIEFYFENFRRGWSERGQLTREHDLYRQQYCGCLYSEWERYHDTTMDTILTPGEEGGEQEAYCAS
jgi:predicted adenine nucleotide alpha hydrolase (AANH) superfamily ATPase